MTVRPCEVNHSDFLLNLSQYEAEEVVPSEADLHVRYVSSLKCARQSTMAGYFAIRDDEPWLKGLVCKRCQYCPAVQSSQHNWLALSDILQSSTEVSGWREARTEHERWLQTVLNNVVYYLNEPPDYHHQESDYALPGPEDKVSGT